MDRIWDCIVVGGGAAGLSAALVLGRARRSTLLVDSGRQSNLAAHGIGGLLGSDGRPPADFYAGAHRELAEYPAVEVRAGEVVGGARDHDGFTLELDGGERVRALRVLLATGMDYRPPELPGVAERWGGSVFHCPFCHGWEVRERPLGVLDRGESGARRALMLRAWSDDVTLLTDGPAELDGPAAEQLRAAGVTIDERRVAELRGDGEALGAVAFQDGSERPLEGLLVPATLHQRSALAEQLGAATREPNPIVADALETEASQTTVPGLYAAGDLTGDMPSVVNALATGSRAAAMIVHDLMARAPEPAAAGG